MSVDRLLYLPLALCVTLLVAWFAAAASHVVKGLAPLVYEDLFAPMFRAISRSLGVDVERTPGVLKWWILVLMLLSSLSLRCCEFFRAKAKNRACRAPQTRKET